MTTATLATRAKASAERTFARPTKFAGECFALDKLFSAGFSGTGAEWFPDRGDKFFGGTHTRREKRSTMGVTHQPGTLGHARIRIILRRSEQFGIHETFRECRRIAGKECFFCPRR